MTNLNLVLDADSIVYRVGFAYEESASSYEVYDAVDRLVGNILFQSQAQTYNVFLNTNKPTFRHKLATIRPYKGNRKQLKPRWYSEIREYLISELGAVIIDDIEADDAVGICHYTKWKDNPESSCIASIDKDLNQLPGWHYNYVTQEYYYVSQEEAEDFFYTQLLMGDAIDNIQGVPKIGQAKARKILEGALTEKQKYNRCLNAYYNYYNKYHEDEVENILLENANLLYILREEGKMYGPPAD